MTANLSYGAWLLGVWIALWGRLSVANVMSGLVVVAVLLAAFPRRRHSPGAVLRPLPAAVFLGYFLWKLVEASAIVAWEVLTPGNRVNEGIVAVRIRGVSDGITTVVANTISLVPGTLTLEVRTDPVVLYVHVLHLGDPEAVRREVLHLEALAARALGHARALDTMAVETAGAGSVRQSPAAEAVAERAEEELN